MRARHIEFFETESGKAPVADYLEALKWNKERATIMRQFEDVEIMPVLPQNRFKKFKGGGNLWEIKIGRHRFLGFYTGRQIDGAPELMLVHAFAKQSNHTPAHETEVALRRRIAYLQRAAQP